MNYYKGCINRQQNIHKNKKLIKRETEPLFEAQVVIEFDLLISNLQFFLDGHEIFLKQDRSLRILSLPRLINIIKL